jgi:hypothetical protein
MVSPEWEAAPGVVDLHVRCMNKKCKAFVLVSHIVRNGARPGHGVVEAPPLLCRYCGRLMQEVEV